MRRNRLKITITAAGLAVALLGLATCAASDVPGKKSLRKALALSFVMPGAGQAYLGNGGRAKTMLVSEVAVWSTFAYYRVQGRMREDKYREMARLFAGVEREMDEDYYKLIAYYTSSEEYNVDVMREARLRYPFDRDRQLEYFSLNGYFGDDGWEWDSVGTRLEYSRVRTNTKHSYRNALLTTGFALLNRMVSMIDVYLSYRVGGQGRKAARFGLGADETPQGGAEVYFSMRF